METTRKVTEQEIEKLYKFTRQHFVEYFDVQIELVDHLASSIEAIWAENPTVKFEDALNSTFKKFGVFGFSEIVEKRTNAMDKRYAKKLLKYAMNRLKWPKVISSLVFTFIIFYAIVLLGYSRYFLISLFVIGAILAFVKLYFFKKKWKEKTSGTKILAIESSIKAPGWTIFIVYQIFISPVFVSGNGATFQYFMNHQLVMFAYVFVFTLCSLVVYDSIYGLEDEIEKSYNKYLSLV